MENNFLKVLNRRRFPIYANLQLTYKCNFKCLHCYQTPIKNLPKKELNIDEWMKIIDILKEQKTLLIHFTGGEVFTRKDFLDIYNYAYNNHFKIIISTNVSLINDTIVDVFSEKKPYKISVTLYGMSDKTYIKFTRNSSFKTVYNNILKLRKYNIDISLKTIGNIYNKNELKEMKSFSQRMNIEFYSFFKIENYLNGDSSPRKLELSINEINTLQKEFGQLDTFINYKKEHIQKVTCSAGNNIVNIDPYGYIFLCDCSKIHTWNLLRYGFNYCWEKIQIERNNELKENPYCKNCNLKNYCDICTPMIKYKYGKLCKPLTECAFAQNLKNILEEKYDNY